MTDDNSTSNDKNLVDMDDLNAFEEKFFNRESKASEVEEKVVEAPEDEIAETEDDALATDDEDVSSDEENEDEPEEEVAEEQPKPKKNRKSYQERIDELTRQAREAQRERDDLRIRLEERTRKTEVKQEETPLRDILPADAPNPDALDKDGNHVYALGEFDPRFIADLTRYTIQKETTAQREKDAQESRNREVQEAQNALKTSWAEKVEKTKEEIPEIIEEIGGLVDTFQSLDPGYGEYLAMTIMAADNGPEIMHYLSQNIGEAQKIVASGPAAATRAIGRLEGLLSRDAEANSNTKSKKVSEAPPPPRQATRGQSGRTAISPDTDDLDAFEKLYFSKKR